MAKSTSNHRSSHSGKFVTVTSARGSSHVKTKLGNVTVSGIKPSPELVKTNVARSTAALARVSEKLMKPGVHLPQKKGVPRYSADENSPGIIIRRLNGQVTTGRLKNGQFVESE